MVNGTCEVLRGHCTKSNGAFYYNSYFEFEEELDFLQQHPAEVDVMLQNAGAYVTENYRWDVIMDKLTELIEMVAEGKPSNAFGV